MPLPTDQETRLRCFRNALRNWRYQGYVRFKRIAEEWLLNAGISLGLTCEILHEHVEQGGRIDEVREVRPEYAFWEFHYDLRVKVGDRRLYFETVLECKKPDDPDDPVITVVSVHDV